MKKNAVKRHSMKCIVCKKEMHELDFAPRHDEDPSMNCWDDCVVDWLFSGYGSGHDTHKFLVCLCDECISNLCEEGIIQSKSWLRD
jgi:hypothetical protein